MNRTFNLRPAGGPPPGRRLVLALPAVLAALLLGAACASPPVPRERPAAGPGSALADASLASGRAEVAELERRAAEAEASGHLVEAIRLRLALLDGARSGRLEAEAGARAESALRGIEARLSLEPSSEWIDASGSQRGVFLPRPGEEPEAQPSVYLFMNYGSGKSPVADAPIRFESPGGAAELIPLVATDAYGKANSALRGMKDPASPLTVRAFPLFTFGGAEYPFNSLARDFLYLPRGRSARVLVRAEGGFASAAAAASAEGPAGTPGSNGPFDAAEEMLQRSLAELGFALVSPPGPLSEESIRSAFATTEPGLSKAAEGVDYLVLLRFSAAAPRQMELNGRKYAIFTAEAEAGLRVLDSRGRFVWTLPLSGIKGQGADAESSLRSAAKLTLEAVERELAARRAELEAALSGR